MHRRLLLVAGAALLAACSVTPPPTVEPDLGFPLPEQFSAGAGGTSTAPGATWWRDFGDPHLDELVTAVLAGNHDLRAAIARFDAAAAGRTIAGGEAWPAVDAGLDGGRARRNFVGFPFGGGGGVPSNTSSSFALSLSVRWELDVWGRIRAGESAAAAELQAAAADFAGARQSLITAACRAWFAAVAARQQLALAEATAASQRATVADLQDRYRRGVRPALDVHLAASNLATTDAERAAAANHLQAALRRLEVLAGDYPAARLVVDASLPTTLPPIPGGLPADLLQRRPDLCAAERRLAATGCRVDAARAALFPRLSLTASGGTSSDQLEDLLDEDFRVWSLGANLLQPLFRSGALAAEVDRAAARRSEALAQYTGAVLTAFAEVETALAGAQWLAARADALATAAHHATAARDLARQRWQLGVADFLAVADGQRQAFQAETARIAAAEARLGNRLDLYLALGGGLATPPAAPAQRP